MSSIATVVCVVREHLSTFCHKYRKCLSADVKVHSPGGSALAPSHLGGGLVTITGRIEVAEEPDDLHKDSCEMSSV